jgi:uncharacterized repeat protein (TIGR01451 family)
VRDRRTGVTERVSVGTRGAEGNGDSNMLGISTDPAISDDGRYVAFKSEATNLVKGDRNGLTDVFVRDRVAGTTERVSVDSRGREGDGDNPAISPDGRYVAFESASFDGDSAEDVYLRDRVAGTTERISVSLDGGERFSPADDPAVGLAPGGPVVAFSSSDPNLVLEDDDSNTDVFVRDLSGPAPVTERVSVSSDEQPSSEFSTSRDPDISGDGRHVAFTSEAMNFTSPPHETISTDIFVRDRQAGTTVLASPSGNGGEAGGESEDPNISSTGRYVSFASFAPDHIPGETDPDGTLVRDAFVRDLEAGTTELVSVASDHSHATRDGFDDDVGAGPVSTDGLVTLLATQADNLFAGDDNSANDVYVTDARPSADLSLTKDDAPDPVARRANLTYTLTAANDGPSAAPDAAVLDTLPGGVTFVQASGGCSHTAGKVECDLGTLASGESRTVTITVAPSSPGTITNRASVGSAAPDPNRSNNTAEATTTVVR